MPRTGRPPREKVQVACAGCGQQMLRWPCQVERSRSGRYFCGKACRDRIGCKPRRKAEKVCEWCSQTFYPLKSGGPGRFCSIACHDGWQGRNKVRRQCEVCGAEFTLSPSIALSTAGRWCSHPCAGRARFRRAIDREHNGKPVLKTPQGYLKVWEPEHPNGRSGWILEHRLVVERVLGRHLTSEEHVHHINRDRTDNRPENLEVMDPHEHSVRTGYERALREQREREELAEYRKRFGPLP